MTAKEAPAAFDEPSLQDRLISSLARTPLAFAPACHGRFRPSQYHARGAGYHVKVAAHEAYVGLLRRHAVADRAQSEHGALSTVRIRFVGANQNAAVHASDPLSGTFSYFPSPGTNGEHCTGQHYNRIRFADVYDGVDVAYYGSGDELEFDVIVAPRSAVSSIRLAVDNADHIGLDERGDLLIDADGAMLVLRKPVAYQEHSGQRHAVASEFILDAGGEVSLRVASYDRDLALTIDPVLSYATYVGGGSTDFGTAIAVDASGNAYIAGYTTSVDFPMLSPYDKTLASSDVDAFVTKLNASGKGLVYSTYLGGAGIDRALAIAVDSAGNAYVTGTTTGAFPVTGGAYQASSTGRDSFVAKLGPAGNTLVYSTYIQGVEASAIAVDASGNAFVTGRVMTSFATTSGAYQRTPGGAFVLKLNPSGSAASYATYLGGGGNERANSLVLDKSGNAYLAGVTDSLAFPVVGALQPTKAGGTDGFVAKLSASGEALLYSTYLGGALDDGVNGIAIDSEGYVYVAGETYSPDFPVANAFISQKPGARLTNASLGSAFVAKIDTRANALVYSSFLGGEICNTACSVASAPAQYPGDAAYGIDVDDQGHAYVAGLARSYTFPLVNSLKPAKTQDNQDSAFVAKVSRSGGALLYSTLIRTGPAESAPSSTRFPAGAATGIAADSTGAAYVTGDADSASNFTTLNAYQTTNAGGQGAVALKLAGVTGALSLTSSARVVTAPTPVTLTATISGASLSGTVMFTDGTATIGSAAISGSKAVLTLVLPPGIHRLSALYPVSGKELDAAVINVVVENALACN